MDKVIPVGDRRFALLLPASAIQERVAELGRTLSAELAGRDPLFLVVLNGAFMFAADLMKHISIPATISFIRLASYEGMNSSGKVTITGGLQEDISGRHVVLLEDIIDTGTTLHYFLPELQQYRPASIQVAACFTKPDALLFTDAGADYACFDLPEKFVLGYGMDYNGYGRNYPDLYEVLPE
jgi:hypoxanthine phosphoribosyltransferase